MCDPEPSEGGRLSVLCVDLILGTRGSWWSGRLDFCTYILYREGQDTRYMYVLPSRILLSLHHCTTADGGTTLRPDGISGG